MYHKLENLLYLSLCLDQDIHFSAQFLLRLVVNPCFTQEFRGTEISERGAKSKCSGADIHL